MRRRLKNSDWERGDKPCGGLDFGWQQKNLAGFYHFWRENSPVSGITLWRLRPLVVATKGFGEPLASIDGEDACQAVRVLPILMTLK
jgi:hypothetical protein